MGTLQFLMHALAERTGARGSEAQIGSRWTIPSSSSHMLQWRH